MGGGKRDYNQKERWRKVKTKPIEVKNDKKAPPKKEDVDNLMNLWLNKDKKKEENKDE